jgi:hypothetical protein
MSKFKPKKPKTGSTTKHRTKPKAKEIKPLAPLDVDCPYRGKLYRALFLESNRDYTPKDQLLKKVADLTDKPISSVEFAWDVLKNPKHRSNDGRSTMLEEDGKVKLIAIQKAAH